MALHHSVNLTKLALTCRKDLPDLFLSCSNWWLTAFLEGFQTDPSDYEFTAPFPLERIAYDDGSLCPDEDMIEEMVADGFTTILIFFDHEWETHAVFPTHRDHVLFMLKYTGSDPIGL